MRISRGNLLLSLLRILSSPVHQLSFSINLDRPQFFVERFGTHRGHDGERTPVGREHDFFITIQIAPHPHLRVNGRDIETDITITPWEAALGMAASSLIVVMNALRAQ